MRGVRARVNLPAVCALVLASSATYAQPPQDDIARVSLIREAEQARDAGDHPRALEIATRAGRIRMTPSLQLLIAQEHDRLGHAVDAHANALGCQRAAEVDAALRNRDTLLATCGALAQTLRARVGSVQVRAPSLAGVVVRVNGGALPEAVRGVPRVVEPGAVRVEVTAPGYAPWRRTLSVRAGASVDVSAELQRAAAVSAPSGPGAGPWIVAGLGVASFATAGVLFAMVGDARSERDALCTSAGCHPSAVARNGDYESRLLGTNIALGLGGALLATGMTWWLIARLRGRSERPGAMSVSVAPSAQGWSVGVGGAL